MRAILRIPMLFVLLASVLLSSFSATVSATEATPDRNDAHAVLAPFIEKELVDGEAVAIDDDQKHLILFYMGLALLILIIATAIIGLQMALFGKQLFVPHMICAGFTVTLSLVHAVTAIVWFLPYKIF